MLSVVITGAGGQLGRSLVSRARQRGFSVLALDRATCDIGSSIALDRALAGHAFDVLINAAAYTQVDRAEAEPDAAFAVNRDAPALLARVCRRADALLTHVSTDYVFDGEQSTPYRETDEPRPINVYGQSKLAGELAVQDSGARHVIVRTSWVFSPFGQNFVKSILRLAGERETLRIVADQSGAPTYAGDLADALLSLSERAFSARSDSGTYHFAGCPTSTWHGFALQIVHHARTTQPLAVKEITPITSAQYPTAARRPAHSILDCQKIAALGVTVPDWRVGLDETIRALAQSSDC